MLFLVVFEIDAFTNGYMDILKRGGKIRYIIEITHTKLNIVINYAN